MTVDATKQALFDKGLELHMAFKASQVRELEIARTQAAARIQAKLDARNVFIAALVDEEGFSIADITRMTNNKDWNTAKAAIAAGREIRGHTPATEVQDEAQDGPAGPFVWNAESGVLSVTFAAEDFAPHLAMLARHPHYDGEAWSFEYDGHRILPTHADDDTTWEHPVVQVMMTDGGKAQAIAFIESQAKKVAA
jgi:hypothetical protein